ncbi:MAG: hypothetical protein GQ574_21650 [Crocinitomix sp.]|nr:hypothetical protein [Crocinitomix sp.]
MAISDSVGQQLLDVPMGDMIREMAFAIAEAQIKLDENSIEVAEMMGGLSTITDDAGNITFEDSRVFFGNESITFNASIALFNSADLGFKRILAGKMLNTSFDYLESDGITAIADITDSGVTDLQMTGAIAVLAAAANADTLISVPVRLSMLELGFTPTFYQFVDTIIEVRIAISFTQEAATVRSSSSGGKSVTKTKTLGRRRRKLGKKNKNRTITTSQVNATYASKYSYSAEGSSLLRTKLAPVPPPAILEERIRLQLQESKITEPTPVPVVVV